MVYWHWQHTDGKDKIDQVNAMEKVMTTDEPEFTFK